MAEEYGLIEEKQEQPRFPVRRLIRVPHQSGSLIVTRDAFGPSTLNNNVAEMQNSYCYPNTHEVVSFREPTTSESISAAAYDFPRITKSEIFDIRWLQAGRVFKAPEWVVINPPKDKQGAPITDERVLKKYLEGVEKVNGIYLLSNGKIEGVRDCSIVPYESFVQGVQSGEDFARGGLARGLEYASGNKSPNLEIITSKENYPRGVDVFGFNPEGKVRVVSLYSDRYLDLRGLDILGDYWDGNLNGCAFGVLRETSVAGSQKIKQ